jgi:hypothetical protein
MESRRVKLLGATLIGALAACALAQMTRASQEPGLPPQHQAISGLHAHSGEGARQKPEHIHIIIDEVESKNWGFAGMLTTEYGAQGK